MFIKKICSITGNRPQNLPFINFGHIEDENYMSYIESIYYSLMQQTKQGYNYFVLGGALGVDLDVAEAIIACRDGNVGLKYDIKLEIAVPCKNQTLKWKAQDKLRYEKVLSMADYVVYISEIYTKDCMQKRNEYMVDVADCVLAFWNGEKSGGTYNTIKYAKKKNKQIEIVNLKEICIYDKKVDS